MSTEAFQDLADGIGFADVWKLPVLTARELCALPDPPEEDRLLGPLVVRRQRTILAGGTGEGKTVFGLRMVHAIVNADDFLHWTGTGGRVLVIDLEQGQRTVKRRLRETRLNNSDLVDYSRVPDGLALDRNTEQIDAVEKRIADNDYAAVLLDPFYKAHQGDSNAERAIVDLMRLFDRWREQYGFALILPAHTRKKLEPGAKLTIDDIFGSTAIVRGAEIVIAVQRVTTGYSRLYFFKDRDGDDTIQVGEHWNLLFDRDTGYRRDPQDTAPARDLTAEIVSWLLEHPRSTTNEVAAGVSAGRKHVSDILKKDPQFSFQPGPNRSRQWVASASETHLGHQSTQGSVSGGPLGGSLEESTHEATHDPGASDDWLDELYDRHADLAEDAA